MKNFAYRDAESAKKPNDLNQAIESTIVVATNEWKYHAEIKKEWMTYPWCPVILEKLIKWFLI